MTTNDVRSRFLDFFRERGHAIIPSASLIPENDPTVLFTTAGMHPLVPYFSGQTHPAGRRLASAQKCLRTDDIDAVGDNRHLTFFEMLGNWSLGDYFKQEAIGWSFAFLTDSAWLGLDPKRLFVTVFEGDADAPCDDESIEAWQKQFASIGIHALVGERIFAYPKKKNWWGPAGATGPCGPDTEIFYDTGRAHDGAFGERCHPNCDCGRFVEIWNNVFMEYEKQSDGSFRPLAQKNVDTGMGLERMATVMQGVETVFETDAFMPLMRAITKRAKGSDAKTERSHRIIADHLRAATFVIGDERGVAPSNIGQGYIVRRLVRRAIREGRRIGIEGSFLPELAETVVREYGSVYPELVKNQPRIVEALSREEEKFGKTLEKGMRELEKMVVSEEGMDGDQAFFLFSTYGFPLELTEELIRDMGMSVDRQAFEAEFKKHQQLSRTASAGTFKGGLADHSAETTRLHTATHLLHQALRAVLGEHVEQRGSNITAERLRFDFSHGAKMTPEEIARVEAMVNDVIAQDVTVRCEEMSVADAKARGVIGLFEDTYAQIGDKVKVYFVGDFSKEICGGPHVTHTGELGSLTIQKEEAVAAGVRRIKARVMGPS